MNPATELLNENSQQIILLSAAEGPRTSAFQKALAHRRRAPATVFSYQSLLEKPDQFREAILPGAWLRFDSPDREIRTLQAVYLAGQELAETAGYKVLSSRQIEGLSFRRGNLGSPAQLALGLNKAHRLAEKLGKDLGVSLSASPSQIALSFDKLRCSEFLRSHQLSTPRQFGEISSFDALKATLARHNCERVFVKLRHGFSAGAMTALMVARSGKMLAYTTAEIGKDDEIYTTRKVRRLEGRQEIADLINRLTPYGLIAEEWVPKAGTHNKICDLRIITVAGKPVFNVLRASKSPMTNLHLGGQRGDPELLSVRMEKTHWQAMLSSCREVAKLFRDCFTLGIDVAVHTNLKSHSILEVNAFGSFVKDVKYKGCSPAEWEILQWTWDQKTRQNTAADRNL